VQSCKSGRKHWLGLSESDHRVDEPDSAVAAMAAITASIDLRDILDHGELQLGRSAHPNLFPSRLIADQA
jgi:hypothetical protein